MKKNVMDIVERFQTHHALQEERELKNSHAAANDSIAPSVPDKNGMPGNSIFETEEVQVSTVIVPRSTEWSPPHDGRDRLVVTLGKIDQLSLGDSGPVFPARWTWVPANSDFQVANGADQTRNLMIVEFNDAGSERPPVISLTE
ncbi:MAG: hypothetical protein QOI22_2104 [Verrucomicrobiota bacterium]|jgi:hypothetical protein